MRNNEKIPVFRPPLPAEMTSKLSECLESRWWGYGPACSKLERAFTQHRGGWSLATNSCTSALHILGRLLRGAGDGEVIVPAMTFVSTAMAFKTAGLQPVAVDVDPITLMIDETDVARRITERTRAVVVVHLYGQRKELSKLRVLCDRHGIALIEDCAHCIGELTEPPIGDFACYSFNAVKEAPAGEGGLIWGRSPSFEAPAREISYLGMAVDTWQRAAEAKHRSYEFGSGEGLKFRLTDVAATFVLTSLPHLDSWRRQRKDIFSNFEAQLFRAPNVQWFPRHAGDSYLMFVVRLPENDRDRVRHAMATAGVATSTHYPSLSRHPAWKHPDLMCPVAEQAESELLTLPCFPDLTTSDQSRVIAAWNAAWV